MKAVNLTINAFVSGAMFSLVVSRLIDDDFAGAGLCGALCLLQLFTHIEKIKNLP